MQPELLHCRLLCSSSAEHLTQIYTGFGQLQRKGLVSLTFERDANYRPGILTKPKLHVVVNDQLRLTYDASDDGELTQTDLDNCDYYFKRSYRRETVESFKASHKVQPLGLNYPVYGPGDGAMRRAFWSLLSDQSLLKRAFLLQFIRNNTWCSRLLRTNGGRINGAIANFEGLPRYTKTPRIIFFTRAWQPARVSDRPALVEERHQINHMRATCIRLLRHEFGAAFVGGFEPSEFVREQFPDCMADGQQTRKRNYLETLRTASIGIATMGLQGSNGWKLAEYVAGAKAILSEKLIFEAPGIFVPGKNYLEFTTPEECVAGARQLAGNPGQLYQMTRQNYEYYQAYLRPDMLIWNTLQTALSGN